MAAPTLCLTKTKYLRLSKNTEVSNLKFDPKQFLPASVLSQITEIRVSDPERSLQVARERERRDQLTLNGKLSILAADHPARRVTRVGDNPLRMADRHEYMARILRVMMSDSVDGLLATMDIIEDLLLIHDLLKQKGRAAFLDNKLLIVSFNRAGLLGSSWEIDDPISGPSAASCAEWRLDGAKILLRLCDAEPGSLKTLLATVRAITELNAVGLPMFLESLPVTKTPEGYKIIKDAVELAKTAGAAAALGDSSRYLWLKLPYCENYAMVAQATTLPILLLGGEPVGDATPFLRELEAGLQAGPNVRGALVGRNILYPGDDDPLAIIESVNGIIHKDWTLAEAVEAQESYRHRSLDWLADLC
jgi:DhnA family fructose-bisphosphate aldolase class Ia